MHYVIDFLQNSPVYDDGHVTLLTNIKRKPETESGVSVNSSLVFLSISQLTVFLDEQIFLNRFQLYLIVNEAEEREHINEIMHQKITNGSRKKLSNKSDVHLSLRFVITDDYDHLFMINVNIVRAFSVALFNAHQLLSA